MKFVKEEMRMLANEESDNFTKVRDAIVDHTRWSVVHEMIFKDNKTGKHYVVYFNRGATEMQDEQPFEYDNDPITCSEVESKEVTTVQWVKKEA